ncbi:PREDICTED: T-cell activation Rho GTPase-activating protein-like [Calidris pugnax]|uniref:T-cell activation Rho GTPase-activating protein-like n=1 Tax=Calidris pugnax TaxID=198806 RepID=UPI00071C32D3|nr:PREDICTED: T-cell activation Rho GTPase-activating protein-like [Calidris pugnax]
MRRPPGGAQGARLTRLPSIKLLRKELRRRQAATTLHASSLQRLVERQAEDLLSLLHRHGPSTEGIFRLAAGEQASRQLREALDTGAEVHLESQPAHLLAVILKDFLRKIPSKLLQAPLYQEWMSALQKDSTLEKVAALKE